MVSGCGERRSGGVLTCARRAYLGLVINEERKMTKLFTILIATSLVVVSAMPALYAVAALA